MKKSRRTFVKQSSLTLGGIVMGSSLFPILGCNNPKSSSEEQNEAEDETVNKAETLFKISLAQWSLNKSLKAGALDNLDFAAKARNDFGLDAVEYVNQFFEDKAKDMKYLGEMKKRADENGVKSLLIMIDNEGNLGNTNEPSRVQSVENHYKWIDAAKFLGCHSIRVNAGVKVRRKRWLRQPLKV